MDMKPEDMPENLRWYGWIDTEENRRKIADYCESFKTKESTKFLLIEVIDREISNPDTYYTWEDAHNEMCSRIADILHITKEEVKESYMKGEELDDSTCVIENAAWSTYKSAYYDWKIFQIETLKTLQMIFTIIQLHIFYLD